MIPVAEFKRMSLEEVTARASSPERFSHAQLQQLPALWRERHALPDDWAIVERSDVPVLTVAYYDNAFRIKREEFMIDSVIQFGSFNLHFAQNSLHIPHEDD